MVLILVLMEDTLRAQVKFIMPDGSMSLNPCFNGRYSQSATSVQTDGDVGVLILVLMEDTLRVLQRHGSLQHWVS